MNSASTKASKVGRGSTRAIFLGAAAVLCGVACGAPPDGQAELTTTKGDLSLKSLVTAAQCCDALFEESLDCREPRSNRKSDVEKVRRCAREQVDLLLGKAQCLKQSLKRSGICRTPDMVSAPIVEKTCGPEATAIDGGSCAVIKQDAALVVVDERAAAALARSGLAVVRQPELADAGFFTAEVSLPRSSSLWTEIGSVTLPPAVAALKVSSPEALRALFLAVWLRSQPGVRHARPVYGMTSTAILNGITDTGYSPGGDFLATASSKLVNLRESWQVLQFSRFASSEVRLAVVDGGFTVGNSDLDDPIDIGVMGEAHDKKGSEWHGHWVASAAGAVGNNGALASGTSPLAAQGIDWLSPKPSLRVIRVHVGTYWDPEMGAGIGRAIDAGADIINMSFARNCDSACQFFGYDPVLDPTVWALKRARDNQIIAVAAAGNEKTDLGPASQYQIPCELGPDLALCVGAVNAIGGLSSYSNYGGDVAVYAPGDAIRVAADASSALPTVLKSGTSLAAPFVSGVLSGLVAIWGNVRTVVARDAVAASVSNVTGWPVLDAAAMFRRAATPAADRFEGGDFVDPLPTTGELLTLTDEDQYSFSAAACETVAVEIDYVPLKDGATAPYVAVTGGRDRVPFTVTDPAAGRRVVIMGPLDAANYALVLGRRPSGADPVQLALGYTLTVTRTGGANCESSALEGVSIPSTVEANRPFTAAVTFRNTGATVWHPETHRVAAELGGDVFSFPTGMPVTFDVHPGQSFTATFQLKAPSTEDARPLRLRMYRDGVGYFGAATPDVTVTTIASTGLDVRFEPPAGDVPPRVCQAPAMYRYTLVNQGTSAWDADFRLQAYRHEAGLSAPWEPWLSAPIGRRVDPGDRVTLELLLERIDVPGFWEIRAELQATGVSIGAGSAIAQSGIGIYENGDSNNAAELRSFVTPSGAEEGEAGLFEGTYHNTGCNPWRASTGYYLESIAGHWSPSAIGLDEVGATPVNGTLTRAFTSVATSYDVQNGESVNPSAWRLRTTTWFSAPTPTRVIPIAHAYATCASFIVPPIVSAGQTFPVVMRLKNTGGTTWTRAVGYHLGYTPPNATTWGPAFVELEANERIDPGQTKEFRWWATAPAAPGPYDFYWMMYRGQQYFFDACGPASPITVQ